jgi:hypothetical protein
MTGVSKRACECGLRVPVGVNEQDSVHERLRVAFTMSNWKRRNGHAVVTRK